MSRRTVVDMGKNLVPPRPFLTPVSALGVVRERLKRLVGIAPLLTDGFKALGVSTEEATRPLGEFAQITPPAKMHVRGDTTTGCTGNPSCCPACGIEAFLRAPVMIAPGRAAERPTLASESRPGTMPRKVARRPPNGKRMLAMEEET